MRPRHLLKLTLCVLLTACGGGGSDTGSTSIPTVTGPTAVATLALSAASASVLVGATVQLSAVPKDAQGNVLTGRTITFTSSSTAVASVSSAGLVTTVAPGTAMITAASEGVSSSTVIDVVDPRNIPTFTKPFAGDYPVANFLDHNFPKEFVDNNNVFVTFWGEAHPGLGLMVDGHSGYDYLMPVGTPLFAVAAGKVVIAQSSSPAFFCPPLNRSVTDQADVYVEHALPGGVTVQSRYSHVSRIDVTVGQQVTAGQQVGLSGNTGCSTAAHLHFEVDRMTQTNNGTRTEIDPYGWTGAGVDPWEQLPAGAASIQLWKTGQAPQLWREFTLPLAATPIAAVAITKVVYEGVNDAVNPNNEYVELTLDTRFAQSASFSGYALRGDASGLNFAFPASATLTTATPKLRVYTGSGTNSATEIYMGRPSGVWSNLVNNDCVRLVSPGGSQYRLNLGNGCP